MFLNITTAKNILRLNLFQNEHKIFYLFCMFICYYIYMLISYLLLICMFIICLSTHKQANYPLLTR